MMSYGCHWPGCRVIVGDHFWSCGPHWFWLPEDIRRALQRAYRPGQERDGGGSDDYYRAARRAFAWAALEGQDTGGETEG